MVALPMVEMPSLGKPTVELVRVELSIMEVVLIRLGVEQLMVDLTIVVGESMVKMSAVELSCIALDLDSSGSGLNCSGWIMLEEPMPEMPSVEVVRVELIIVAEPMVEMSAVELVRVDLPCLVLDLSRVGYSILLIPTLNLPMVRLPGMGLLMVVLFGMIQSRVELPNRNWSSLTDWLSWQEVSSTNSISSDT